MYSEVAIPFPLPMESAVSALQRSASASPLGAGISAAGTCLWIVASGFSRDGD